MYMTISRPERDSDSVASFAAGLRELRLGAGDPKLLALSERTGVSKTVLSEAFLGRKLPTERTVAKLVEEFGGDRTAWVSRRAALDPRYGAASVAVTASAAAEVPNPGRRFSLVQTLLIAAVAAVIAVGGTSLFWAGQVGKTAAVIEAPELAAGP